MSKIPKLDEKSTTDSVATGKNKPLGERLVDAGVLSESQLNLALREKKRRGGFLGELLVEMGFVSPDVITANLADESEVDVVEVRDRLIEAEVLNLISYDIAKQFKVIPLEIMDGKLLVVFADSFDVVAIDALERKSGYPIEVATAPEAHIMEAIERSYAREQSIYDTIEEIMSGESETLDVGDHSPMIQLVDQIISMGVRSRCTDIHIHPEEKILRIRIRVDGILRQEVDVPKSLQSAVIARLKLMADLDITEKRKPQDGRIRFTFGSGNVDLRVSTLPTNHGESIVMRVLDSGTVQQTLSELGFSGRDLKRFRSAIDRSFGMVLVTGPTGSGKTTSLYTALGDIDCESRGVFTLEDPIEYTLPFVRQTQVNPDVGMDFAAGLRSLLRQDPDVILVGEIRDQETAELAVRAALSGHLVFSTLHTNSAVGVIPRLIDMGIDRYLLPSALVGIVGQRLLRKLCQHCRTEKSGVDPLLNDLEFSPKTDSTLTHWLAEGCDSCNQTGYSGRLAVYEVLLIDETFHDAILSAASEPELLDLARKAGMTTMMEDGLLKTIYGETSVAEVFRVLR